MNDRTDSSTAVLVMALFVIALLIAGAAGVFLWQQRYQVAAQREAMMARQQELAALARAASTRAHDAQANNERPGAQTDGPPEADETTSASATEDRTSNPARVDNIGPSAVTDAVRDVLQQQQQAWNAGDIDRFMEFYWKSDNLTFSSRGKVTRSWQNVLESYKRRYSSRQQMGELVFDALEITPLGADAALVLGNWTVRREPDAIGGNFTLVLRRLEGKWLIVHDHTSRAEE
jgi:beta-aspartyl-peptidase (threonine type)